MQAELDAFSFPGILGHVVIDAVVVAVVVLVQRMALDMQMAWGELCHVVSLYG